jgi:hypothetical protein
MRGATTLFERIRLTRSTEKLIAKAAPAGYDSSNCLIPARPPTFGVFPP